MAAPVFVTGPPPATLSESAFLSRIGLDLTNPQHKQAFATMQADARAAWQRLRNDRRVLLPQFRQDPTVRPPFPGPKISSQAFMEEVAYIYRNASSETRPFYNLSRVAGGTSQGQGASPPEHNWVIKWILWQVYRQQSMIDSRRDSARPWNSNGQTPNSCGPSPTASTLSRRQFWDPVRQTR